MRQSICGGFCCAFVSLRFYPATVPCCAPAVREALPTTVTSPRESLSASSLRRASTVKVEIGGAKVGDSTLTAHSEPYNRAPIHAKPVGFEDSRLER